MLDAAQLAQGATAQLLEGDGLEASAADDDNTNQKLTPPAAAVAASKAKGASRYKVAPEPQ